MRNNSGEKQHVSFVLFLVLERCYVEHFILKKSLVICHPLQNRLAVLSLRHLFDLSNIKNYEKSQ